MSTAIKTIRGTITNEAEVFSGNMVVHKHCWILQEGLWCWHLLPIFALFSSHRPNKMKIGNMQVFVSVYAMDFFLCRTIYDLR